MAPVATGSSPPIPTPTSNSSKTSNPSLDIVLHYPDLVGPTSTGTTRRRFIASLRRATVLGFFYLSSSPLEEHRSHLFELTRQFFALPVQERKEIAQVHSRHFRGYSGIGSELTQSKEDNREQVDLGMEAPPLPLEVTRLRPYLNLWGPNQLPSEDKVPGLREAVLVYMEAAEEVVIQLTGAIEEALGVEAGTLQRFLGLKEKEESFDRVRRLVKRLEDGEEELDEATLLAHLPRQMPYERMKLVRYGQTGNSQGVGAHRDGGWITLLSTDSKPGLQVEDPSNKIWLDVPYRSNCIVTNFGQQIERITSGLISAATHRVWINSNSEARYSIPYFAMPSLTSVIRPIPLEAMSSEALEVWREARRVAPERQSIVPEGDLHGAAEEVFGLSAWRGLVRSHPDTFEAWYHGS